MKLSTIVPCAAPWALVAELAAAASGAGAVLPPHGATTYVAEVVGRVIDVAELGRGEIETLVEATGVTRNTLGQSAFDKMRTHCLISFTAGGGRSSIVGACRETDGDGDILLTSFDGEAGKLLGGTGKYAGMTGSAVFSVKPEPSSESGKMAYSVNHDVTWAEKRPLKEQSTCSPELRSSSRRSLRLPAFGHLDGPFQARRGCRK